MNLTSNGSDISVSRGPKQDQDWFNSNGTVQDYQDALGLLSGLRSNNAFDRIKSIVGIIASFFGGYS